jgi:uncharacterized membrane protein
MNKGWSGSRRRLSGGRWHRQQGAVAIFVAVAMMALLSAVALTIDIGRMYSAKATLQKQANLAAVDGARVVARCQSWGAPESSTVTEAVHASLARNAFEHVDEIRIETGRIAIDGESAHRYLVPGDPADADGIRVTLSRPLPAPLIPWVRSGEDRMMRASATAQQEAVASFFIGSELAGLDGGLLNGLLGALLCAPGDSHCQQNVIGLNVANSINGLVDVGVSLGQLGVAVGLQVKDLADPLALSTQTPLLSEILNGLVGALGDGVGYTVSNLLQGLGQAAAGNPNRVLLDDLLGNVGEAGAEAPFINLLDLLIALGQAATPAGSVVPIQLPVNLHIPGVTSVHAFVEVNAPPRFSGFGRAGDATATSAALSLKLRLEVDAVSNITQGLRQVLSILDYLLAIDISVTPLKLGIDIDVARAVARLDRLQCPRFGINGGNPVVELSASPALAAVNLGTFDGSALSAPPIKPGSSRLLGINAKVTLLSFIELLQLGVNVFIDNPGPRGPNAESARPLPYPVTEFTRVTVDNLLDPVRSLPYYWLAENPDSVANPQTVGAQNVLRNTLADLFALLNIRATDPAGNSSTQLCVVGICIPLGQVLDAVLTPVILLLQGILTGVGGLVDVILDPLLELLGVRLGSATVTVNAVSVEPPRIVSTALPPLQP